jgi:hypothetical protein
MIRYLRTYLRQKAAQHRLAQLVEAKRNSFEVQSFVKHRAAALKGRRA